MKNLLDIQNQFGAKFSAIAFTWCKIMPCTKSSQYNKERNHNPFTSTSSISMITIGILDSSSRVDYPLFMTIWIRPLLQIYLKN